MSQLDWPKTKVYSFSSRSQEHKADGDDDGGENMVIFGGFGDNSHCSHYSVTYSHRNLTT